MAGAFSGGLKVIQTHHATDDRTDGIYKKTSSQKKEANKEVKMVAHRDSNAKSKKHGCGTGERVLRSLGFSNNVLEKRGSTLSGKEGAWEIWEALKKGDFLFFVYEKRPVSARRYGEMKIRPSVGG